MQTHDQVKFTVKEVDMMFRIKGYACQTQRELSLLPIMISVCVCVCVCVRACE